MNRQELLIKRLERELDQERSKRQELEERCRRYAAIINHIAKRRKQENDQAAHKAEHDGKPVPETPDMPTRPTRNKHNGG